MKSYPQQEREYMNSPVFTSSKNLGKKVRCPLCHGKIFEANLKKYGQCFSCHMRESVTTRRDKK